MKIGWKYPDEHTVVISGERRKLPRKNKWRIYLVLESGEVRREQEFDTLQRLSKTQLANTLTCLIDQFRTEVGPLSHAEWTAEVLPK